MHWQCRSPSITYSSEVVMPKQIRVLIEISVHFSFEKSQVQHFCFWFKFQVGLTLSSPFQNHKRFKILLWFKYFLHVHLLLLHLVYFQKTEFIRLLSLSIFSDIDDLFKRYEIWWKQFFELFIDTFVLLPWEEVIKAVMDNFDIKVFCQT